jgi:riboflavin kinase/FMN adenylyltransferase
MSGGLLIPLPSDGAPAGPSFDDAATLIVVGNFDGVHRGHAAVLSDAVKLAAARRLVPAVLTFDPHPAAVVGQGAGPPLTTVERRAELMGRLGVARVYVRTFDVAFAAWAPERFARELVHATLRAKVVMVGENFRFGAKRAGDLPLLQELGSALGFEVRVHALSRDIEGPYSSTRARMCVARGDLEAAAEVLGRPHAISGVVAHGAKRGRTIGFPTANLEGIPELLPPDGVYAVAVDALAHSGEGGARALARGVMNIGVRPTVGGEPARTVEAHLFDFDGDLYGARLRAHLHARLRDEKKFDGLDALKAQIAEDAAEARAKLAGVREDGSYG